MIDEMNRRAETAKQNDDSDMVEAANEQAVAAAEQQGRAGGNLATDVATQATEQRVRDPQAHEGVDKSDDIAHGTRTQVKGIPEQVVSERD